MKRLYFFILILSPFSIFVGCAVHPQLTPMQKRQITTRIIDSTYELVFKATLTVLQDQGYIIKNTDLQTGLISATASRETGGGDQFMQALFLGYVADKGSDMDVSFMINKINESTTEVRLNIQESKFGQYSKWSGTSRTNVKQIYDPEIYNSLFNDIKTEVKRIEAIQGIQEE